METTSSVSNKLPQRNRERPKALRGKYPSRRRGWDFFFSLDAEWEFNFAFNWQLFKETFLIRFAGENKNDFNVLANIKRIDRNVACARWQMESQSRAQIDSKWFASKQIAQFSGHII